MVEADYRKLVKEFEKLNADNSWYYLSFSDYVAFLEEWTLKQEKKKELPTKRARIINVLVHSKAENLGATSYYEAFKNRDIETLDNALYETAHLLQMTNIWSPGADHGYYGLNITPELLAANMPNRIEKLLPKENGLSSGAYSGAVIANLLMAIWYDDAALKKQAVERAQIKLTRKLTGYERGMINCYLAILQKDVDGLNDGLGELCKGWRKNMWFGMNPFNRGFCVPAHAAFNLAHLAYGRQLGDDVKMPKEANFCQDLAVYQKERGFKHGEVYHIYPPILNELNELMRFEPPTMHLLVVGKERYIDTKRFENDVVEGLMALGSATV